MTKDFAPVEILTERLVLRPWRPSEAPIMFRWASNPAIGPIAGWPTHTSVEESREIIATVFSAPETYALELRTEGVPIGSVALKRGAAMSPALLESGIEGVEADAELGYWLAEPYWGRGLMSEAVRAVIARAFEELGHSRLWCGHFEGNARSQRTMTGCGFAYHHTVHNRPTLLGDLRIEHFYVLERG